MLLGVIVLLVGILVTLDSIRKMERADDARERHERETWDRIARGGRPGGW